MHQDYESINSDKHSLSQFDIYSREDLIALVQTLTIQLQETRAQLNELQLEQEDNAW